MRTEGRSALALVSQGKKEELKGKGKGFLYLIISNLTQYPGAHLPTMHYIASLGSPSPSLSTVLGAHLPPPWILGAHLPPIGAHLPLMGTHLPLFVMHNSRLLSLWSPSPGFWEPNSRHGSPTPSLSTAVGAHLPVYPQNWSPTPTYWSPTPTKSPLSY